MSYLSKFKIGRPGYEYEFLDNPAYIEVSPGEISKETRNKQGEIKKSLYRFAPVIKLTSISNYTVAELNKLIDLKNDVQGSHWLLINDALSILREYRTSATVSTVKLMNASRANITIVGVWLATDYTKVGTNYYTGGNFVESTLTITLGTVLSGANTDVIIEYTYQGWYIKIDPEGLTFNMKGNMGWVDISLTMRGDNG